MLCINCSCNTKNPKFCSRSCSAIYNNKKRKRSKESRLKTKNSLHKFYEKNSHLLKPKIEKSCKICSIKFTTKNDNINHCSKKCADITTGRERGKLSAAKRNKRSKDEIALYELIKNKFPDALSNYIIIDGWDADIVIPSLKYAILWNGPWHYKQLNIKNHSLKQVQTRDNIKKELFSKLGYKIYIFEDRYYNPQSAFLEIIK